MSDANLKLTKQCLNSKLLVIGLQIATTYKNVQLSIVKLKG